MEVSVATKHIAQLVADYTMVVVHGYTVVVRLFAVVVKTAAMLQTAAEVAQG